MNHSPILRRLCSLCAALALPLGAASAAAAPSASDAPDKRKAAATKKKASHSVRIKNSQNHSGETAAERDRRMYRECKGLPNAGACRGYTQR